MGEIVLRKCCGKEPVLRYLPDLRCWAVECRVNGHIHNTGFCDTRQQAEKVWNYGHDHHDPH